MRLLYAWSASLSNASAHPAAPLFSPGLGYGSPLVEVSFPDLGCALPYRFVVDTGAPATTVSAELSLEMNLRPLHAVGVRLDGQPAPWARIPRMNLGDIELRQVPVVVADSIPPVGSTESQVVVDGILGMNVLSALAFEIRPQEGRLVVHPPGHPLSGALVELGASSSRLVIAGGVGVGAEGDEGRPEAPGASDEEELSWAPILIPAGGPRTPPRAALAPPAGERARWLPPGGPHLLQLSTGLASTQVHPELLPWAGGIGELATEAIPLQVSLVEHMTAELLDEQPPADVLREVTRYTLPTLSLGPLTLTDLGLYHRDDPWPYAPLAAVLGADVLSTVTLGVDVSQRRLTLRQGDPPEVAPSIQTHLMRWAEGMLEAQSTDYLAQEEAMRRFLLAGRWPEAAQLASRLIQFNPSAVTAWMVMARQAERQGNLDRGLQFYRRLYWVRLGRVPAILGAARLTFLGGDIEGALSELSAADADSLTGRARIWRARAQLYLAKGSVEAARDALHRALDGTVDDAGARRGLAWLAWEEGRLEEAEAHLVAALNMSPDDTFCQDLMVAVLRRQGREEEIGPWVETLARHFPYPAPDGRDPIAPLRIRLARERGDVATAQAILRTQDEAQRRAAEASPAPRVRARALEMRARMSLAARANLVEALTFASDAVAMDPSHRAGLLIGADILRVLGDPSTASAYERAWRALPFDLAAWLAAQGRFVPELAPELERPAPTTAKPQKKKGIQYRLPDKQ